MADTGMNYSDYLDDELHLSSENHTERLKMKKEEALDILFTLTNLLPRFKGKYHKKLNLTKLFNKFQIPVQERTTYIELILEFQTLFHSVFPSHSLRFTQKNSSMYFTTEPFKSVSAQPIETSDIPKKVSISQADLSLLNDVVYMFLNIRRGKGFDLSESSSDIVKGVKQLRKDHPYLFFSNGHGLVYPTEFGIEIGRKVNSYLKCNRTFESITVHECEITTK